MKERFYLYKRQYGGDADHLVAIFKSRASLIRYIDNKQKEWERERDFIAGPAPDYFWHSVLVEE